MAQSRRSWADQVIAVAGMWLFMRSREHYVLLRNAMIASGVIAFACFWLVPTAPPRLAGLGYVDTITIWSSSYRVLQPPEHTNPYAALPSLHVGWGLLVGVVLFISTRNLLLRLGAVAMPTAMALAVIATGNHWVMDIAVAVLVGSAAMALAYTAPRAGRWSREAAQGRTPP